MNPKGQAAIEYLAVFGIALILSTPFILKAQTSILDLREGSGAITAKNSMQEIESAVETVSASGEPARRTFSIRLPDSVVSGQIVNRSVVYTLRGRSGESQLIRSFGTNITGTLPQEPGRHRITVYMNNSEANIKVVS